METYCIPWDEVIDFHRDIRKEWVKHYDEEKATEKERLRRIAAAEAIERRKERIIANRVARTLLKKRKGNVKT